MGHVYVDLQIENPINREWDTLEAVMVDTGCTHTMLPSEFLRNIGIESLMTMPIQYINDEDELPARPICAWEGNLLRSRAWSYSARRTGSS